MLAFIFQVYPLGPILDPYVEPKASGCKHVFETCYVWWMQVVASVCQWLLVDAYTHIKHQIGSITFILHMHMNVFVYGLKLDVLSYGCCIWMSEYAQIQYLHGQRNLHTYWTHDTLMIRIKEVNQISRPPDFALDKKHIHTLCIFSYGTRNRLRTMDAFV